MIKFSCEKVFLQNAIAVTSRAVAQKSSIPAGIRTNVFANVVEGGDIVLNARLFGDIIRRMPDDMITFTADEKMMVHVSCGDADFDILGLSAADYPDLPEVEDEYAVSMQQKVLRSMIEEVAFAVSTRKRWCEYRSAYCSRRWSTAGPRGSTDLPAPEWSSSGQRPGW